MWLYSNNVIKKFIYIQYNNTIYNIFDFISQIDFKKNKPLSWFISICTRLTPFLCYSFDSVVFLLVDYTFVTFVITLNM